MRVLHLSTYDIYGGAALAAHRLHVGLCSAGVDSQMYVRRRYGNTEGVAAPGGLWGRLQVRCRRRIDEWLARRAGWRSLPRFSAGMVGLPMRRVVEAFAPDVVQLHWIADGFVDLRELRCFGRPIVWTLHDMWPFTGGCHYAGTCCRFERECGLCPLLGARQEADLSRRIWQRKKAAFAGLDLRVVSPSRWLAGLARSSALFQGIAQRVIPYGIDVERFATMPSALARQRFNLPLDKIVVLGGASVFRTEPRKGFDLFAEFARRIMALAPERYAFVVFGTPPAGPIDVDGIPVIELGSISDQAVLAAVYAAADVFVAPSREDNLPNTLLEAMACGTPAASFAVGGIPEVICDGINGCLARPFDIAELAAKVHALLRDPATVARARAAARNKATTEYASAIAAERYRALYEEVLATR